MEIERLSNDHSQEDITEDRPVIYLGRLSSREMVEVTGINYLNSPDGYIGLPLRELLKASIENGSGGDTVIWVRSGDSETNQQLQTELSETKIESLLKLVNGAVQIDFTARELMIEDENVHLPKIQYIMLEQLSQNIGAALTRGQIMQVCWGSEFYSSRNVDVHISTLRKNLGKYHPLIKTIHGYGYILKDIDPAQLETQEEVQEP